MERSSRNFSRSQVTSSHYLLIRTDVVQKTVIGWPWLQNKSTTPRDREKIVLKRSVQEMISSLTSIMRPRLENNGLAEHIDSQRSCHYTGKSSPGVL